MPFARYEAAHPVVLSLIEPSIREKAPAFLLSPLPVDLLSLTTISARITARDIRRFTRAMKNTKYDSLRHLVSVASGIFHLRLHVDVAGVSLIPSFGHTGSWSREMMREFNQ
jgi:hypothetical protein